MACRWRLKVVAAEMPTIKKLPSGRYQIKPNDSDRKKGVTKETFDTEADANARLVEIRRQLASGTVRPDESKITVGDAARQWLAIKDAIGEIRPNTHYMYEYYVRVHIAGTPLGDRPMAKVIYEDDIVPWLESRRERLKDVSNLLTVLRGIFQEWIDVGRPVAAGGNPVRKRMVKSQPKEVPLFTVEQMDCWRECLIPDLRAMFDVERWYGSRTGEVRGLRETDISWSGPRDPEAPLARELARLADLPAERYAERNVTLRFERQLDPRKNRLGPTKNTRATRTMALPQHLARSLVDHWANWPPVDGWIFVCYRWSGKLLESRPWGYERVRLYLKEAAVAAGLDLPKGRATHVLRHHRVSMLGDLGFDSHQIGQWIGDTPQMVDKIYRHPMPGSLDRMQKSMEDQLASKPDHRPTDDQSEGGA